MVLSSILKAVLVLIIAKIIMINAGPAAKAYAKNLGPNNALFQKGLACNPWYKNAVTK